MSGDIELADSAALLTDRNAVIWNVVLGIALYRLAI